MLEAILQRQFRSPDSPRGIIFTRTRQSAHSLLLWLQQQPGLQTVDIRPQVLTGAGNNSQKTQMIQMTQVWALGLGAYSAESFVHIGEELRVGEFPRGEKKGTESSPSNGGLIISRGRAESWGRDRDPEFPSAEGSPSLEVSGGRDAEAWGIYGDRRVMSSEQRVRGLGSLA